MNNKFLCFILLITVVLLSACKTTTGKGEIIEEPRHLSNFNSIVLESSADININQGPWSVKVKGYENLVPELKTEVKNNQLIISSATNAIIDNNNLEVNVTLPDLVGLEIKGAGDVKTVSPMNLNNLQIDLRGTSYIMLEGTAQFIQSNLQGTGTIKLCKMESAQVNANLTGTGSIFVLANQSLNAIVSGTGDIGYLGNPIVAKQVTGVGSIYAINNCN